MRIDQSAGSGGQNVAGENFLRNPSLYGDSVPGENGGWGVMVSGDSEEELPRTTVAPPRGLAGGVQKSVARHYLPAVWHEDKNSLLSRGFLFEPFHQVRFCRTGQDRHIKGAWVTHAMMEPNGD